MTLQSLYEIFQKQKPALQDLSEALQANPAVESACWDLSLRDYASQSVIEIYVEAELQNGFGVTWWLDVTCQEGKAILDARILENSPQGQDTLHTYPLRSIHTEEQANQAFCDLLATTGCLDRYIVQTAQKSPSPIAEVVV